MGRKNSLKPTMTRYFFQRPLRIESGISEMRVLSVFSWLPSPRSIGSVGRLDDSMFFLLDIA
jgi:hypothetical protein